MKLVSHQSTKINIISSCSEETVTKDTHNMGDHEGEIPGQMRH